ncbi:DUF397 domain-containing protein [Amycolatopsis minnesotensis]|uniref:DUF397 domain-containing protein n=1 Tax=Amycolatopsis minnesotensis TaxID=337894 RepID=A0ABP5DBK6_9PSEU
MSPRDLPSPRWFKSSYSDDTANCVEVAFLPDWRKSSYSNSSANCVEVAFVAAAVGVRDSKAPTSPALVLPALAWQGFVRELSS